MERTSTMEAMGEFTQLWMDFAQKHQADMHTGNWVHMFAVLTGTALAMGEAPPSKLQEILESAKDATLAVYENAHIFIKKQHLQ